MAALQSGLSRAGSLLPGFTLYRQVSHVIGTVMMSLWPFIQVAVQGWLAIEPNTWQQICRVSPEGCYASTRAGHLLEQALMCI